jgi:GNAT superfamily N-acetyltransferase
MSFQTIIKTKELSLNQVEQINQVWNDEYPIKLNNRFRILLNDAKSYMHYIIENEKQEIIAWGVMFEKEDEHRFSILVVKKYQGQELGKQLIDSFKKDYPIFFGWVIDHDNDVKINGEKYVSPLPFYLKHGFKILNEQRIDTEMISAVKVLFENQRN